jgi:hypothetical protein
MIVPAEKSTGQNSAYRHQIMKGASETERPSLFFAKHAQKRSNRNHLIHSVPPATLPHFVQPVLELKQPPEGIRAEAATPGGYFPRRHFGMRTHPTHHLNIVGAGGNKVTQRPRLETGGSEKPAIYRTIVMIRARPAE